MINNFIKNLAIFTGISFSIFLLSFIVLAWDGPQTAPPAGNTPKPLNLGTAGTSQRVEGGFNVGGVLIGDTGIIPNASTATRPTCNSSTEGMQWYDYSSKDLSVCNGSSWIVVAAATKYSVPAGYDDICYDSIREEVKLYFTTVGTTQWTIPSPISSIDVFLVGGGGASGWGGGGGGYTKTYKSDATGYRDGAALAVTGDTMLEITVGDGADSGLNGEASTVSYYTTSTVLSASGGEYGGTHAGGNGGSGGSSYGNTSGCTAGGSNGSNGVNSYTTGGTGQGHTTKEFGEDTGTVYAGGGGGCNNLASCTGPTVAGGGGGCNQNGTDGLGGGAGSHGYAGSGIVILRMNASALLTDGFAECSS